MNYKLLLNYNDLGAYFTSKKTLWKKFTSEGIVTGSKKTRYAYRDNGASVLLIAHIDTVQKPVLNPDGLTGAGFDDRVGVFAADQLSKKYPKLFDMVITDFEESGNTTIRHFTPTHEYNFIVELDREGCDFVHYDTASEEFCEIFTRKTGIPEGHGSYSDIAELYHLQTSAINLGIGVYHSHQKDSGFNRAVCDTQLRLLVEFVRKFGAAKYPYIDTYQRTDTYDDCIDEWDDWNGEHRPEYCKECPFLCECNGREDCYYDCIDDYGAYTESSSV